MPKLGTKRELDSLAAAADYCEKQGLPLHKELRTLYAKLTKPAGPQHSAPIAAIEAALLAHSNGIVLAAGGGEGYWGRMSKAYGSLNATPDQAVLIAEWMAKQPWLKTHRYTVDTLVYKWPNYLAQAQAMGTTTAGNDGWSRPEFE